MHKPQPIEEPTVKAPKELKAKTFKKIEAISSVIELFSFLAAIPPTIINSTTDEESDKKSS